MKFVKEHKCGLLEREGSEGVAVKQYLRVEEKQWYHNNGGKLHVILYCPYCGKKLD